MEPDITTQFQLNTRETIQILPSLALGFTAVCFSVGLVIVNLRLARYGIFSGELVRSEYVITGALFIFLVSLTQISLSYGLKEIESAAPQWREGRRIFSALSVIFGLIEILAPITTTLTFISDIKFMWIVIGTLIYASAMGKALFEQLNELWRAGVVPSSTESTETERRIQFRRLLMLFVFNFLSITFYASYAYPHLSPAIGGGKRDQVMMLATEQGIALSKSLSLPVQLDTRLIGPLQLLTETDSEIIIVIEPNESTIFQALRHQQALRLQRSMFEAILTVPIKYKE